MISGKTSNCDIYIYGLYTNETKIIRYVGKTKNLKKRLSQHINDKKHNYKNCWIKKCKKNNEVILIKVLEVCNESNWQEKEIFWIAKLNKQNKLTNHCRGGQGGHPKKHKLSYVQVKNYIQKNFPNIKTCKTYRNFIRENKHLKLPIKPDEVYKNNGWNTWKDFLNSKNVYSKIKFQTFFDFNHAKKIIQKYEIKTSRIYFTFIKENDLIQFPPRPDITYKTTGWKSWGDYLGTNSISRQEQNKNFLDYNSLKKFMQENYPTIKSVSQFKKFIKEHTVLMHIIPSKPERTYRKKGWINWRIFLNSEFKSSYEIHLKYLNYDNSKKYIQKNLNHLKSSKEYKNYLQHNDIQELPKNPNVTYKCNGWISWSDYLNV